MPLKSIRKAAKCRENSESCVFHSDRDSQYCGKEVRRLFKKNGLSKSMGRSGNCYDNTAAEPIANGSKVENPDLV
jgi:transposase InsO family protein